jgi:phosphoglycerate dehydrogenase-like enzyme
VESLHELLEQSDAVSIHAPLSPETLHLVDADFVSHREALRVLQGFEPRNCVNRLQLTTT